MDILNEIIKDFKVYKNKFYVFEKHKLVITLTFVCLGLIFAILGFLSIEKDFLTVVINSLMMFTFDFPDSFTHENPFLFLSMIFVGLSLFSTALFTFFQDFVNKSIAKRSIEKNHTLVFGLGSINRAFLNSKFTKEDDLVVVIEADSNNTYIEEYRKKGFGVIVGDALSHEQLKLLNYEKMNNAIIALGNDRVNMELTIKLIETIEKKSLETPIKLFVHIEDSELKEIFHQDFVLPYQENKSLKIDVKTFSFNEECTKDLFDNHRILRPKTIQSNNPFSSVVLGDGKLAISIIKDLLLLSNLPNKNVHTIYLMSKKAKEFFENVKLETYFSEKKFPTVKFEFIEQDYKSYQFYENKTLWQESLENIYVCYDDEEINLNIAIALHEKVFLRRKDLKTKVLFAMFNEYTLSKKISENRSSFNRFYSFGNSDELFSKDKLVDENNYKIAKMIHNGYKVVYEEKSLIESIETLNDKWFEGISYHKKLSNIAQSKHVDIKLQFLGLKRVKSNKNRKGILRANKKLFDEILLPLMKESNLDYEKLKICSLELPKLYDNKEFEVLYLPRKYQTVFEKLVNSEHERWNAFHFLNGWEYREKRNDLLKEHDCLKDLEEFKEKELQMTIIYDIYSIVYIPYYLANASYELIKIED